MKARIVYRWAKPQDHEAIIEFLRQNFYPNEPLTNSYEPKKQDIHDELACRCILQDGICSLALCDGVIVGAFLAAPKGPDEERHLLKEAARLSGTKFGKMLLLLAALEHKANVFERFHVDKAFHGQVVAVHPNFLGKGIGFTVIKNVVEEAKQLGYPLFTIDCTSSHSIRIAQRLGMECVNSYRYAEYRAPGSDEQIFFPPKEQSEVQTLAIRL